MKVITMKILLPNLAVMMIAVIAGCSQGTPGGPGTTDKSIKKSTVGQTEDTFNLSVPMMASALKQGEKTDVSVGIKRARDFDEDVSLQFSNVPKGITVEPANPVIKHGDTDAKFVFKAGDEAALGEFKIKIKGHPKKGGDAEIEFKLHVISAKESFTLSAPRFSTSLKQGETKTVMIGIKREKNFDQDVTLGFGEMPTGVTFKPSAPVIKNGETDAEITLTGAQDAALGEFDIKMTGHPATGTDTSNEFKLNIVKR